MAEGEGLEICSLLPAIGGGFGCNPCSVLHRERQGAVEHYREIVDLAADLGAGMVLYIGGWRAEGMSYEDGWSHSLDCLRSVARHAADSGIIIAIEPTTADTNLIDTAGDARKMMEETECANVKLMFDTCHIAFEGRPLADYVEDMGDALVHLHAADTGRKAIGKGEMDWDFLLKALIAHDYKGYFTVETGFGSRYLDPRDTAKSSIDYLKSRLAVLAA